MTFGACKKPFANCFVEILNSLATSEMFFVYDVNASETLENWGLPGERETLAALVETLRNREGSEDYLWTQMHGEEE